MSSVKTDLIENGAGDTPFVPSTDIPKSDVQSAIEYVKANSSAALSDGDYGDITVSGSGTTWTIDAGVISATKLASDAVTTAKIADDAVTYAKIQNVTATDKLLGRSTAGAGDVEEIACTAAGRALLDDADASAQRTTLGLGTLATQNATSVTVEDLTVSQATFLTGVITPSQIAANQNDYSPTGFEDATVVRLSSDAARSITGLAGGASGRVLQLYNAGSFTITLSDESASSAASNRFGFISDHGLIAGESIQLIYDGTLSRWRPASSAGLLRNVSASDYITSTVSGGTASLSVPLDSTPSFLGPVGCNVVATSNGINLTVTLQDFYGNGVDTGTRCRFPFQTSSSGTCTPDWSGSLSAASLTITSGSTFGRSGSSPFALWLLAIQNGGHVVCGAINCLSGTDVFPLGKIGVISTTAEGGAGAADSAHVVYTASALTNKPYVVLARLSWESGMASGLWDTSPTHVTLVNSSTKLPGDVVQRVRTTTGAVATTTTTIPFDDTIPQNTEGGEFMTKAITPSSAASVLNVKALGYFYHSAATALSMALFQDSTAGALVANSSIGFAASGYGGPVPIDYTMLAATTSATTFKIRAGGDVAGTMTFNGTSGARKFGGVLNSYLEIEEIVA